MPHFRFERHLPYPREPLFDLVADVEAYPEFLPGWRAARIVRREPAGFIVEQELGIRAWSWRFRTRARFERPERIAIESREAPFVHLEQEWRFAEHGDCGTGIVLEVDYALRGSLLRHLVRQLFDEGFRRTLGAFEARARATIGRDHAAARGGE